MTESKGHNISECPIGMNVCYKTCYFWRDKCDYDQAIKEFWPYRQDIIKNEEKGEEGDEIK